MICWRTSAWSLGFKRVSSFSRWSRSIAANSARYLSRVFFFSYLLHPMPPARRTQTVQTIIVVQLIAQKQSDVRDQKSADTELRIAELEGLKRDIVKSLHRRRHRPLTVSHAILRDPVSFCRRESG